MIKHARAIRISSLTFPRRFEINFDMEEVQLDEVAGEGVVGEDNMRAVDFVVLAEFDIDTGSTIRHQYPKPIPGYTADYFANYMLPEGVHKRAQDSNYIFLNRDGVHGATREWIHPDSDSDLGPNAGAGAGAGAGADGDGEAGAADSKQPFLYGLNIVKTEYDTSVRRGATVKAIAVFSRHSYVHVFKPALESALALYFGGQFDDKDDNSLAVDLYTSLNQLQMTSVPRRNAVQRAVMNYWSGAMVAAESSAARHMASVGHVHAMSLAFNGNVIPLRIPLNRSPDEVGESCVKLLLSAFGTDAMKIYHAVLVGQRVCFVGYSHSASELAALVLAAVRLVSPPLAGVIKRAFPYASLTDLTFLECPGFIAGCTNPIFSGHHEWWDLLCVLGGDHDSEVGTVSQAGADAKESGGARIVGHVVTSEQARRKKDGHGGRPSIGGSSASAGVSSGDGLGNAMGTVGMLHEDVKFITHVMSAVDAGHDVLDEDWAVRMFRDYTWNILQRGLDRQTLAAQAQVQVHTADASSSVLGGGGGMRAGMPSTGAGADGSGGSCEAVSPLSPAETQPLAASTRNRTNSGAVLAGAVAVGAPTALRASRTAFLGGSMAAVRAYATAVREVQVAQSTEVVAMAPHPWCWVAQIDAQAEAGGGTGGIVNDGGVGLDGETLRYAVRVLQGAAVVNQTDLLGGTATGGSDDAQSRSPSRNILSRLARGSSSASSNTSGSGQAAAVAADEGPKIVHENPRVAKMQENPRYSSSPSSPASTAPLSDSRGSVHEDSSPSTTGPTSMAGSVTTNPTSTIVSTEVTLATWQLLLEAVQTEGGAQALLSMLPHSTGGLHAVAVGLLHSDVRVRNVCRYVLVTMEAYQSTSHAVLSLSRMLRLAHDAPLSAPQGRSRSSSLTA